MTAKQSGKFKTSMYKVLENMLSLLLAFVLLESSVPRGWARNCYTDQKFPKVV